MSFISNSIWVGALLLSSFCFSAFSQNLQSSVRVIPLSKDAVIKIDGLLLNQKEWIKLDTGMHTVESWAPTKITVTKEFLLKENQMKTIFLRFENSEKFNEFKKEKWAYDRKMFAYRYGTLTAFTLFFSYTYFVTIGELEKSSDKHYEEAINKLNPSFWAVDEVADRAAFEQSKEQYESDIDEINKQWTVIGLSATGAAIITYFTWKRSNKLIKPVYKKEEPFSVFHFSPILHPSLRGASLTYKF